MENHINVEAWVALFREIGLDDEKMNLWHHLFELRHPVSHQSFLEWLGCSAQDIDRIRLNSR